MPDDKSGMVSKTGKKVNYFLHYFSAVLNLVYKDTVFYIERWIEHQKLELGMCVCKVAT